MKWGNITQFNIPQIEAYQYSWKASQIHLTLKKKKKQLKKLSGSSSSTLFRRLLLCLYLLDARVLLRNRSKDSCRKTTFPASDLGDGCVGTHFIATFPELFRDDKEPGGLNFSLKLLQHCDYHVSSLSKTASFFAPRSNAAIWTNCKHI